VNIFEWKKDLQVSNPIEKEMLNFDVITTLNAVFFVSLSRLASKLHGLHF